MKKWVITLFLITSSIYLSNAQNLSLKQLYKIRYGPLVDTDAITRMMVYNAIHALYINRLKNNITLRTIQRLMIKDWMSCDEETRNIKL